VAPKPYEFRGVVIQSLIGDKPDDHFSSSDTPVHYISLLNKNIPECLVRIEVRSGCPDILIEGGQVWPGKEIRLPGRRTPGKKHRSFSPTLTFNGTPGEEALTIVLYMRRNQKREPKEIGNFEHIIWVV
jgi:hypothetical protein